MSESPNPALPTRMQAVTQRRYGSPREVLRLESVDVPTPAAGEVLVEIKAACLNPLDWHLVTGRPYVARPAFGVFRPRRKRPGNDFAGRVVAVGADVDRFAVGDEVFGWHQGGFAEYLAAPVDQLLPKPANLTFDEAAAVPVAAFTALQAVRDHAAVQPGERVLINGAAGGVGTFAVQIAKHHGAHVTGVCSTRNVERIRSIGADDVVDYTTDDFVERGPFDVIIDNVGSRSAEELIEALAPAGRHIIIGGPKDGGFLSPIDWALRTRRKVNKSGRTAIIFTAKETQEDGAILNEMLIDGSIVPQVADRYPLDRVVDAFELIESGHAPAKLIVVP